MTQVRTIISGVDTPNDHGPATILAAMGMAPLVEAAPRLGFVARVLFRPSFHPEVCVTAQRVGEEATVSLVTLQTNLWYWRCYKLQVANGKRAPDERRPREPERWEETRPVPADRFAAFVDQTVALRVHQRVGPTGGGLDGMTVFGQYRDPAGKLHVFDFRFQDPEHARSQFVRLLHQLAIDLLSDERSIRVLESLHGYLRLGLPVKHQPGRPYVLRLFSALSSTHLWELEASLERVPDEVPLLLDFSNFDDMETVLYPTFGAFLRRSGPTICWTSREHAKMQLVEIGLAAAAIFATREEALAALGTT